MEETGTRICRVCKGPPKPIDDFETKRDEKTNRCKACANLYLRERYAAIKKNKRVRAYKRKIGSNSKVILEDNRNFYKLGVSVGQDRVRELQMALAAMETVNRALVEVIKDADARDAERASLPFTL